MLTGSSKKRTCLVIFCVAFLVLAAGCAAGEEKTAQPQYPKAPEASLVSIGGIQTQLSSYRGSSVVLINFWGLRCQSCIEEMPFLEKLHREYGSRGLVVLGINTDGVDGTLLTKLLSQTSVHVTYPLIVDPDFALVDKFQMLAAPLTILVARDGTVRYRHEGYEPEVEAEYISRIEKLLSE